MKSVILAFATSFAIAVCAALVIFAIVISLSTVRARAWTHGNLVLGNTFIADLSSVILTNDSGSDNLLAQ